MKRPLFGVIAAQIADTEQKQLLQGILTQAQTISANVAVFSNIYNPNETNESLFEENSIYDLAASPDLDGILLLSETIINEPLQQKILSILRRCSHIPVVAVGAELPDFSLPRFRFLNIDDVRDFEALTEHLIVEHGFRNIDLLTGHPQHSCTSVSAISAICIAAFSILFRYQLCTGLHRCKNEPCKISAFKHFPAYRGNCSTVRISGRQVFHAAVSEKHRMHTKPIPKEIYLMSYSVYKYLTIQV